MSKNMTRKGLAFGAIVALGSTLFAGAPANANIPNLLLVPTDGTTYNSILQSGITLKADLNPNDTDTTADAKYLVFRIENPGAKDITVNFDGYANDESSAGNGRQITVTRTTSATASSPIAAGGANFSQRFIAAAETDFADQVLDAGALNQVDTVAVTDAAFIYVSGFEYEDLNGAGASVFTSNKAVAGGLNQLTITSSEPSGNVSLKVQAWLDIDGDGVIDSFEEATAVRDVVLYDAANATATTSITSAVRNDDEIVARVTYGLNINPFMVDQDTRVVFYKDGSTFAVDNTNTAVNAAASGALYTAAAAGERTAANDFLVPVATSATGVLSATAYSAVDTDAGAGTNWNLASGMYTARTVYNASSPDVYIGGPSAAFDLRDGTNNSVTGVKASLTEGANVEYSATDTNAEVELRTGTKSFVVESQIYSTNYTTKLEAAGVQVRAVITGNNIGTGSEITAGGAVGKIDEDDDVIIAYGFTNTKGQVNFTINSNTGAEDDQITVVVSVLLNTGVWSSDGGQTDIDVLWEDAALTTFTSVPAGYASGENVTVTFAAKDQFGEGIDSNVLGAFSVTAVAVLGGVATPSTFSQTKSTSKGEVSFTFANFAKPATPQQLRATLFAGTTAYAASPAAPLFINIYSSLGTNSITIADSYSTAVTYEDYAEGKASAITADIEADTTNRATISGTVLDVNNAGQPGIPVTVAGSGLLFFDGTNYKKDTITLNANEFGFFTVYVYAQKVSSTGHTVTVTAGGKSVTTKLRAYLQDSINDENLAFSWTLPATIVKNTTYAVTAKLTDKWGNPIGAKDAQGNADATDFAVAFQGTGSLEVNGVGTTVYKDFGSNGEVIVFVRSIKDIAGPGSISATLGGNAVYATGNNTATSSLGTVDSSNTTDDVGTVWDETKWASTLSSLVDVKDVAPVTGKVNVGSFNGKLVVYASGLNGARISWKVGGNWGSAVATSNYSIFNRPTPRAGVTVSVEVFVNGVKQLTKSVVTR